MSKLRGGKNKHKKHSGIKDGAIYPEHCKCGANIGRWQRMCYSCQAIDDRKNAKQRD